MFSFHENDSMIFRKCAYVNDCDDINYSFMIILYRFNSDIAFLYVVVHLHSKTIRITIPGIPKQYVCTV